VDPCLTFSIGMRAPSSAELVGDYLDNLIAEADESMRYHDPDLVPPKDPNEIDGAAMTRAVEALNALRLNDPDKLGDWFGRFITTYRAGGEVIAGGDPRSRIEIEWDLEHGAVLQRHPFSRLAWRRHARTAMLFCSGLEFPLPVKDAQQLAAAETMDGRVYAALSEAGRDVAMDLYAQGHYQLLVDEEG
jgi:50S ribosomal protein L16 3-hydroxylase